MCIRDRYYIVNAFAIKANKALIKKLAAFEEVEIIMEDGLFIMADIQKEKNSDRTVTYGLQNIKAPQVWSQGFRGQNVVIGGQDTGYKWDHEQLRDRYRGWNGTTANHHYNWHDAIDENHPMHSGNNPCGYTPVSYTHLDVYKRQISALPLLGISVTIQAISPPALLNFADV